MRLFFTPVPSVLELYFSLIYESYALLRNFSTDILSTEQDYEIEMNAYYLFSKTRSLFVLYCAKLFKLSPVLFLKLIREILLIPCPCFYFL